MAVATAIVGARGSPFWPVSRCGRKLVRTRAAAASSRQGAAEMEDLALRLALQAGEQIRAKSGRAQHIDVKDVRYDLVTEVDRSIERVIQAEIQARFPTHCCVGEETATRSEMERLLGATDSSDWIWIVDPIDGTLNFVGGVPLSVVSIGVAHRGKIELGVVYNPFQDELFVARRGHGAHLNGKPISVLTQETPLEDATVSLGFPSKPELRLRMVDAISKVALKVRSVRALGTAALHMSYVGAGRLGCFFEHGLKPWDIAAARLIVEEAGGRVTAMDGEPLPLLGGSVLASNGGVLHDQLVKLLA